jgi:hypothetical protein
MRTFDGLVFGSLLLLSLSLASLVGAEQVVSVPTDPSAKYTILEITKRSGGMVEVTTRRAGTSGTSYSKRLVDCVNGTFKYLGEGDTIEEMKNSKPSPSMAQLVRGSISTYVSEHACRM